MSIEDIVRTSMDHLVHDLEPTVPDPAGIRARVHRSRRVRSMAAAGIAAAVAAAVVITVAQFHDQPRGAEPTHPVTIGVDPNAVWMVDGVLHLGDQAYPQDKAIGTGLVPIESGAVFGGTGGDIVYQPVDGTAQVLETDGATPPPGSPSPGPAADPDSDLVAVLRWSPDERYDLYFYDAARGRQLGTGLPIGDDSFTLPGDENPFGTTPLAPIEWTGPNAEGGYTALIRNGRDLWRYDAQPNGAGGLQKVGQMPLDVTLDVFADAAPDGGLRFTTPAGDPLATVDRVAADGGLSHDGAFYAGLSTDPDHRGAIAVVDTHTGDTRYLDPPSGTVATLPSWSRGHTLMFRATDVADQPSGLVVACDADALTCTNVAEVDDLDQTVLPRP